MNSGFSKTKQTAITCNIKRYPCYRGVCNLFVSERWILVGTYEKCYYGYQDEFLSGTTLSYILMAMKPCC